MHPLHAQRGGWGKQQLPGCARQAAGAHDLDAEARRSHLPKGEATESHDHACSHTHTPFNQSCKESAYAAA